MALDLMKANGREKRLKLGRYIAADPAICHGKPTYAGIPIMVWHILEVLSDGESVDELVKAGGGRVSRAAVLETIRLSKNALLNERGRLRSRRTHDLAA